MKDAQTVPFLGQILSLGRGRLRIYLGWAPGVGKTRRALLASRAMRERGVDLVIGWLEEKNRPDLFVLAEGIETIPPLVTELGALSRPSLNIPAILERHPSTILIDELAYTSSTRPGLPRLQEIRTLLEHGISVVTTLNALHVEALSEAFSQILGVPVRETIPVDFLREADEIIVVDLPPEDLVRRIKTGEIFSREQVPQALSGPYKRENLVRMRELTLEFVARVLDRQLVRSGGRKGVLERVLVLVSELESSFFPLVEYGGELARRMAGELVVLHLRPLGFFRGKSSLDPALQERYLAETAHAGGKFSGLWTRNPAWTVWRFIRRTRTTALVLGHADRSRSWKGSFVRKILRYFPRIDVELHLIPTVIAPPFPESVPEEAGNPRDLPENHGKFTLYLGAAAGIGKTYRMLSDARERAASGENLVVGYLETHGRPRTEEMAQGLRIVPRKSISYQGLILQEMDLEGILALRPGVALVDELAHTNPPGWKHKKRYQDVLSLLEHGIHVMSTLNVQHVESLNDLVEVQTGIRVHETVPDSVVALADGLVLVDLTPEELQERLLEGHVYPRGKVEEALRNFFTKTNLTALRELAMKQVAESRKRRFLWNTGREILLIGLSDRPEDTVLIRRGAMIAERFRLTLHGLFVRRPGTISRNAEMLKNLLESFGGTFSEEEGPSWEELWIRRTHEWNPRITMLGQSAWRPGSESTAEELAREFPEYPLVIVPVDVRDHLSSRGL